MWPHALLLQAQSHMCSEAFMKRCIIYLNLYTYYAQFGIDTFR